MQRRRTSFAPSAVAPSSFRGSPDSSAQDEGYEEDDQATVIWQGGSSSRSERLGSVGPVPTRQWSDTPMAFEPPAARVPAPIPSMAPMMIDLANELTPSHARRPDVLAWLPLASAACVTVAVAGLLFAIAFTTSFGDRGARSNAAAGATISDVLPASDKVTAAPRMPLIESSVAPALVASAPAAPVATKNAGAPRVDDEAASAQKMLEEAQRETAGAL